MHPELRGNKVIAHTAGDQVGWVQTSNSNLPPEVGIHETDPSWLGSTIQLLHGRHLVATWDGVMVHLGGRF